MSLFGNLSSDPGLIIPLSEPVHGEALGGHVTAPLVEPLSALEHPTSPKAKDFKALREATSLAITQVWSDSVSRTSALEEKFKEGNISFAHKTLSPGRELHLFSGSSDERMQFSVWLRRLEDIIRMRPGVTSSEQKANFLIGHLDGVAREKLDNPASFEQAVSKAQMVEQLLTEATADRLMHPGSVGEAQGGYISRPRITSEGTGSRHGFVPYSRSSDFNRERMGAVVDKGGGGRCIDRDGNPVLQMS
ncbi:unnamed protein product [Nippostrongylus brasiliensis]|uniref:Uncharacterized protein n=1 Tax=Nippostrongylus brasiliensis TaxID=27835 RepID=A0A158R397_NIPBR|nr:unnamed protein product [Nippostrongylus brasiliensis]